MTLFNGPQATCLYQAGQGQPAFSKVQGSPPKAPPYRVAALLDGLKSHHMHRDLNFLGGETWYEHVEAPAKQPPWQPHYLASDDRVSGAMIDIRLDGQIPRLQSHLTTYYLQTKSLVTQYPNGFEIHTFL
jgi:hypothetical protein